MSVDDKLSEVIDLLKDIKISIGNLHDDIINQTNVIKRLSNK